MADQAITIPRGWKMTTLGEVADVIGGGTPKTDVSEYWGGKIPWLSVVDFNNDNRWVYKTEKTITEQGLRNSSTRLLDAGDLIISARGTVGAFAQLKYPMAFNQSCYGLRAKENSENNFLYYLLKQSIQQVKKNVHGAVFDTITRNTFDQITVDVPPLPEQRAIAAVLSSLDGKIDLLREQNKTLEATAQAIFKEWFVNFNFPGATGKMNDSELGEIPKGWRVDSIEKYMTLEYGSSLVADKRKGGEVPVFGSSGIVGHHNEALVKGPGVIVGRAGIPGSVYWSQVDFYCMDSTFYVQTEKKYLYYFNYLLRLLKLDRLQSGSAVPGLNRNNVYALSFFVPTDDLLDLFNDLVRNIFEKIYFNDSQIHTLSKLRDTLLPKLMKGEVRVAGFND